MENLNPTEPKFEPQASPPERGRAWRIVAIVLTLHAALLGSAVLINGCNKSSDPALMGETSSTSTLAENQAEPKREVSNVAGSTVALPQSDILTPEEQLPNLSTDVAQNTSTPVLPEANVPNSTSIGIPEKMEVVEKEVAAKEPAPQESVSAPAPVKTPALVKYTVKKGDTLSKIARTHSVGMRELMVANKLSPKDPLKIGQKLMIPTKTEVAKVDLPRPQPVVAKTSPLATRQVTAQSKTHLVKAGESPTSIAKRYGISVQSLLRANHITDPRRVRVNQKLVIPITKVASETTLPDLRKDAEIRPIAIEEPIAEGEIVKGI